MKKGYKHTEVGIIPEDWEVKPIGELFEISAGGDLEKKFFSKEQTEKNKYPIFSNSPQNKGLYGFSEKFTYSENCITVTARGTIGYSIYRNEKFNAIGRLLVLRPKTDVDCFYFSEYINKYVDFIIELTGVPQLTTPQISKYNIALPPTKAEQTAIATALNDADALIGKLEQLIAKKRNIKTAAMQQLLTPKEGWEVKKLGEVAEIYQPETISQEKFTDDGYLVYGANGIVGKFNKYNHEFWQTTITCRGSTCGTVNKTVDKCWITGNAMVINVDKIPKIDKLFLYFLLSNQDFSDCITGSGQPQIIRKPLIDFKIWVPKSKIEQTRIAQILSDMDNEIQALEKQLEKYKMMKQGMMQVLLTGKIRLV
ncbi:restriction endonuclease subunit S [Rhodoflexus caldus]|uniref:restriction endonuclease subunit S n=1 Tax=Rhodoflexus caldus TaxID=2891236 RepID=UPI002029DB71|nr:restriction endonuclease subunit S [Rhodoflexus caldus]